MATTSEVIWSEPDPYLGEIAQQLKLASDANQQANADSPDTRYQVCLDLAKMWADLGVFARNETSTS
jgi:hypothetical protein